MMKLLCAIDPQGGLHPADGVGFVAAGRHDGLDVLATGYLGDAPDLAARLGLAGGEGGEITRLHAGAYRRWGMAMQAELTGQFVAVVADPRAGDALVTHDALGLAPVFYREENGMLVVGTDILDVLGISSARTIDSEYVADFLATGVGLGPRTPYVAIRRLLPGESLRWQAGRATLVRSWDLAKIQPLRLSSPAGYEEAFRTLLHGAVSSAASKDGTTWISLSGGLDSSSIACIAARGACANVAAYSMVYPQWLEADEQHWMRHVVEQHDLLWHTVDGTTTLPFSILPRTPIGEPTSAVIDEAARIAQSEVLGTTGSSVLLTGHGGDTVLCASPGAVPHHLADPLFDADPLATWRGLGVWRKADPERRSLTYWLTKGIAEPIHSHLRPGHRPSPGAGNDKPAGWLNADYVRSFNLAARALRRTAPRCPRPGQQQLWDGLWFAAMSAATLPGQWAHARYPLLDRKLVEFMSAIPWEQKLRPGCDRLLQRRALRGILPEPIRRRAGKAHHVRAYAIGLARSRTWQDFLCDDPAMARAGLVDLEAWRAAVRSATVGQMHGERHFLAGVALESWLANGAEPDLRPRSLLLAAGPLTKDMGGRDQPALVET